MRWIRMLPLIFIVLPLCVSHAGSVKSLSPEKLIKTASGETYKEVVVSCSGKGIKRIIRRSEKSNKWCAKDINNFCKKSKVPAALKVCSQKYANALRTEKLLPVVPVNPADSQPLLTEAEAGLESRKQKIEPDVQQPVDVNSNDIDSSHQSDIQWQKDRLSIEKERLKLEQQRLDLRKQELEIYKQELELQKQLDAEGVEKKAKNSQARPVVVKTLPGEQKALPTKRDNLPEKKSASVPMLFRSSDSNTE